MRISDWSSDVCSSDLLADQRSGKPDHDEMRAKHEEGIGLYPQEEPGQSGTSYAPCQSPEEQSSGKAQRQINTGHDMRMSGGEAAVDGRKPTLDGCQQHERKRSHSKWQRRHEQLDTPPAGQTAPA